MKGEDLREQKYIKIYKKEQKYMTSKQTIIAIMLTVCGLGANPCMESACAEDSIKVSASELKALIERVERLEQQAEHPNKLGYEAESTKDNVQGTKEGNVQGDKVQCTKEVQSDNVQGTKESTKEEKRGRFTIGGYGEVTAKHCFYSNNYLRYGKNPEKPSAKE